MKKLLIPVLILCVALSLTLPAFADIIVDTPPTDAPEPATGEAALYLPWLLAGVSIAAAAVLAAVIKKRRVKE